MNIKKIGSLNDAIYRIFFFLFRYFHFITINITNEKYPWEISKFWHQNHVQKWIFGSRYSLVSLMNPKVMGWRTKGIPDSSKYHLNIVIDYQLVMLSFGIFFLHHVSPGYLGLLINGHGQELGKLWHRKSIINYGSASAVPLLHTHALNLLCNFSCL